MLVTLNFLQKQKACNSGVVKFQEVFGKQAELKDVIQYAIKQNIIELLQYANWLIVWKMNHEQRIQYAIFAAEQVIGIYEDKYPNDKRPREAIKAAKKYLKSKYKNAAYAAYAAANTANAAAYAAANAANAANAAATRNKMQIKILEYGLKICK